MRPKIRENSLCWKVHSRNETTGECFCDISAALARRMGLQSICTDGMETACGSCGSIVNQSEIQNIADTPQVLCLQLVGWENFQRPTGEWSVRRIPHDMSANEELTLGDAHYDLCGMLLHQGLVIPGAPASTIYFQNSSPRVVRMNANCRS